jgi:hypothetical protein
MPNVLGGIAGLLTGFVIGALVATAIGEPPAIPEAFIAFARTASSGMSFNQITLLAINCSILLYLAAYIVAATAVSPFLASPHGRALPAAAGELAARGFMIGLTAALNFSLLILLLPGCLFDPSPVPSCGWASNGLLALPYWILSLAPFVVLLINGLCVVPTVSHHPMFQSLVGWISWLAPMSYVATGAGIILFIVNLPLSLISLGIGAFRIDLRTGTIETTSGVLGIFSRALGRYPAAPTQAGGFSLGNFNFLIPAIAGPLTGLAAQSAFVGPTLSAHEIGHTLNTSAMGGIVLWINAIDENVPPFRNGASAYGELLAESHSGQAGRNLVRIWG